MELMIVYCDSETCIHNSYRVCQNRYENGKSAVSLIETLGGQMICANQKDRNPNDYDKRNSK